MFTPRLRDGQLTLVALRAYALEFDEATPRGQAYDAEDFIDWLRLEVAGQERRGDDRALEHMRAGQRRRHQPIAFSTEATGRA